MCIIRFRIEKMLDLDRAMLYIFNSSFLPALESGCRGQLFEKKRFKSESNTLVKHIRKF